MPEGGEGGGGGGGGSGAIRKGKGKGTRESVGGEYDEDDELDFGHDDELDLSVSNISLGGAAHGAVATSPSGGDLDFGHDDELDLTEVTWLKSNGGAFRYYTYDTLMLLLLLLLLLFLLRTSWCSYYCPLYLS